MRWRTTGSTMPYSTCTFPNPRAAVPYTTPHAHARHCCSFETEPLPSDSQLWRHPKVTITPHIAGASRAQDMASIFVENAVRWTRGEPLKGAVDFGRGY